MYIRIPIKRIYTYSGLFTRNLCTELHIVYAVFTCIYVQFIVKVYIEPKINMHINVYNREQSGFHKLAMLTIITDMYTQHSV